MTTPVPSFKSSRQASRANSQTGSQRQSNTTGANDYTQLLEATPHNPYGSVTDQLNHQKTSSQHATSHDNFFTHYHAPAINTADNLVQTTDDSTPSNCNQAKAALLNPENWMLLCFTLGSASMFYNAINAIKNPANRKTTADILIATGNIANSAGFLASSSLPFFLSSDSDRKYWPTYIFLAAAIILTAGNAYELFTDINNTSKREIGIGCVEFLAAALMRNYQVYRQKSESSFNAMSKCLYTSLVYGAIFLCFTGSIFFMLPAIKEDESTSVSEKAKILGSVTAPLFILGNAIASYIEWNRESPIRDDASFAETTDHNPALYTQADSEGFMSRLFQRNPKRERSPEQVDPARIAYP